MGKHKNFFFNFPCEIKIIENASPCGDVTQKNSPNRSPPQIHSIFIYPFHHDQLAKSYCTAPSRNENNGDAIVTDTRFHAISCELVSRCAFRSISYNHVF